MDVSGQRNCLLAAHSQIVVETATIGRKEAGDPNGFDVAVVHGRRRYVVANLSRITADGCCCHARVVTVRYVASQSICDPDGRRVPNIGRQRRKANHEGVNPSR